MALRKLFSTSITASTYPGATGSATEPTADGIVDNVGRRRYVRLIPYGTDANNETGSLQIIGWSRQDTTNVWTPTLLGRATFTLCTAIGIANGLVTASGFFADTITVTAVGASTRLEAASNALDMPAFLLVNPLSFDKIEVQMLVGTAASVNCLFEEMDT